MSAWTHVKTDPACQHYRRPYRRPRTALGRWLDRRARGRACRLCMNIRAAEAAMDEIYGRPS